MSAQHTPGPWTGFLDERDGHAAWLIGRGNVRPILAEVAADVECGLTGATVEANARLVAAAPELLQALKEVVAIADRRTVEFDRARAAIAKAEGREL